MTKNEVLLSNAAIHQLGGQAGKNKKVTITARPYLKLANNIIKELLNEFQKYI